MFTGVSGSKERLSVDTADDSTKHIVVNHVGLFSGSKSYPCGLCSSATWVTRIQEHFRAHHSSNMLVAEAVELMGVECDRTLTQGQRDEAYTKRQKTEQLLLNTSTKRHNMRVLNQKHGILCPVRLPTKTSDLKPSNFRFCEMCNGLFKRGRNLKDHCLNHCLQRTDKVNNRKALIKSMTQSAMELPEDVSPELKKLILTMLDDPVTRNVKSDGLILYVGQRFLERDEEHSSHSHVRERMRKMAVLVEKMGLKSMSDLIDPKHWNLLCETARRDFTPSTQGKLGIYIRRAAELLENISIQTNCSVPRERIKDFMHLMDSEWKHRVGHQALLKAEQKSVKGKVNILPVARDVHLLRNHLDEAVSICIKQYEDGEGDPNRTKKVLACKATVFNKRRGMEFVKSTKLEIQEALLHNESQSPNDMEELTKNLSQVEKQLSAKMKLIRINGKQGKVVPVLLEPDDFNLLGKLMGDAACAKDVYLFQNRSNLPLRGHMLLRDISKELVLEKPHLLRATMLRKYMATVVQVLALPKYQLSWVADHLSHDLSIHKKHYRQESDSVELTKIAKLMYLVDHDKMHEVVGKDLDSIDEFLSKEEIFKDIDVDDYEVGCNNGDMIKKHVYILICSKYKSPEYV